MEIKNKGDFFEVIISDEKYKVTVSKATMEDLGNGRSKEEFIEDCFKFLLEREPKESIMKEFNVEIIGKYFPEWKDEIKTRKFK